MKCQRMRIYGKVQGVWFRTSTKRKADELELSGFVRNERDGSVYVEVIGSATVLDSFVNWCWEGPELAQVEKVIIEEMEAQAFEGFEVLR